MGDVLFGVVLLLLFDVCWFWCGCVWLVIEGVFDGVFIGWVLLDVVLF